MRYAYLLLTVAFIAKRSEGSDIYISWKSKNDQLIINCTVVNLHYEVSIFGPSGDLEAHCLPPVYTPRCTSLNKEGRVMQMLITNTTIYTLKDKDISRFNGKWKCQHGSRNDESIEVTVTKVVQYVMRGILTKLILNGMANGDTSILFSATNHHDNTLYKKKLFLRKRFTEIIKLLDNTFVTLGNYVLEHTCSCLNINKLLPPTCSIDLMKLIKKHEVGDLDHACYEKCVTWTVIGFLPTFIIIRILIWSVAFISDVKGKVTASLLSLCTCIGPKRLISAIVCRRIVIILISVYFFIMPFIIGILEKTRCKAPELFSLVGVVCGLLVNIVWYEDKHNQELPHNSDPNIAMLPTQG